MTIESRSNEFRKPEHELNHKQYNDALHQNLNDIVSDLEDAVGSTYTYSASRFHSQLKWLRSKFYKVTGQGSASTYMVRQRQKDEIDIKANKEDVYVTMQLKFGDDIDQLLLRNERKHLLLFVWSCVGKRYNPPTEELYFEEDFVRFANIYIPPRYKPKRQVFHRPKLWQEFLNRLTPPEETCWDAVNESQVQPQQDYIEKWVAQRIKEPQSPPDVALILRGEQGTGKNFLTDSILGVLLGRHNYLSVSLKDLQGSFNQLLFHSALVHIEEINTDKTTASDMLKRVITQDRFMVNEKMLPQYTMDKAFSLVLSSNHPNPITLEATDRRYFVPTWSTVADDTKPYFKRFADWLNNEGGYQEMCNFLHSVDVSDIDFRNPPMTNDKQNLMVLETAQDAKGDSASVYLAQNTDYVFKPAFVGREFKISVQQAQQALREAGFSPHEKRRWQKGAPPFTAWVHKSFAISQGKTPKLWEGKGRDGVSYQLLEDDNNPIHEFLGGPND